MRELQEMQEYIPAQGFFSPNISDSHIPTFPAY